MYKAVEPQPSEGNTEAGKGQVWVCGACGKRAKTRYGFYDDGTLKGGKGNADNKDLTYYEK